MADPAEPTDNPAGRSRTLGVPNAPVIVTRAAVTIGVNKTGDLTPLRAAVSGADDVGAWLSEEGYAVTRLVDSEGPVSIDQIKKVIKAYVELKTLDQLVIYFAGHGYLTGTSEIWLLSGAPEDPDEAIDQNFSAELARSCGIRSVVFISDACRSNPPSIIGSRVQGSSIFPNRISSTVEVEVDRFFATRPGDPALEFDIQEARSAYSGLFTEMLRRTYKDPAQNVLRTLPRDGGNLLVVSNRLLKAFLPERVNEAAQERAILLKQIPQLRLECGEDAYIARATFSPQVDAAHTNFAEDAELFSEDLSKQNPPERIGGSFHKKRWRKRVASTRPSTRLPTSVEPLSTSHVARIRVADQTGHFLTQTGVQVTGARVVEAVATNFIIDVEHRLNFAVSDADQHFRVNVLGPKPGRSEAPGSMLLQFSDGRGTILAVLPGYIASVVVDTGCVVNVSYVPSENSERWHEYVWAKEEIGLRRAQAAAAARSGVLAVDRHDAHNFGNSVRIGKRLDPTLGLYAALAYADVGLKKEIASVRNIMQSDLNADIFDVAVLDDGAVANAPRHTLDDVPPTVPFCPMLSQTWSYLRPRGVKLDPALREASLDRVPALWTTFTTRGVEILRSAMAEGYLK